MKNKINIENPDIGELTKRGFNKNIKIAENQTAESLIEYGMTYNYDPVLYFYREMVNDITFNLTVCKETLEIINIDILDEQFLQPYDYQSILLMGNKNKVAEMVYYKVNEIFSKLQDDGIITGFRVGMYV